MKTILQATPEFTDEVRRKFGALKIIVNGDVTIIMGDTNHYQINWNALSDLSQGTFLAQRITQNGAFRLHDLESGAEKITAPCEWFNVKVIKP